MRLSLNAPDRGFYYYRSAAGSPECVCRRTRSLVQRRGAVRPPLCPRPLPLATTACVDARVVFAGCHHAFLTSCPPTTPVVSPPPATLFADAGCGFSSPGWCCTVPRRPRRGQGPLVWRPRRPASPTGPGSAWGTTLWSWRTRCPPRLCCRCVYGRHWRAGCVFVPQSHACAVYPACHVPSGPPLELGRAPVLPCVNVKPFSVALVRHVCSA
jgi:hypothetical protein